MGKLCPKCGYERKVGDIAPDYECPQCGVVYAKVEAMARREPTTPHDTIQSNTGRRPGTGLAKKEISDSQMAGGCLVIVAGFVVLLFIGALGVDNPGSSSSSRSSRSDDFTAHHYCQEFVTRRLRAPSTAKFSSYRNTVVSKSGYNSWTVRGYVDAQNAFGAQIRQQYTCDISISGSSAKLENLFIY